MKARPAGHCGGGATCGTAWRAMSTVHGMTSSRVAPWRCSCRCFSTLTLSSASSKPRLARDALYDLARCGARASSLSFSMSTVLSGFISPSLARASAHEATAPTTSTGAFGGGGGPVASCLCRCSSAPPCSARQAAAARAFTATRAAFASSSPVSRSSRKLPTAPSTPSVGTPNGNPRLSASISAATARAPPLKSSRPGAGNSSSESSDSSSISAVAAATPSLALRFFPGDRSTPLLSAARFLASCCLAAARMRSPLVS